MDVPAAAAQQVDAASQSTNPFVRDSVCERPPANAEGFGGTDGSTEADVQADDFGLFRKGRKLCIRCVSSVHLGATREHVRVR